MLKFVFLFERLIKLGFGFQNKNKQLIDRNRALLTHIQQLLIYTHELEVKFNQNFEPVKFISCYLI